ncbi:hypothetical protein [Paenibacillus silviterrae]|uniref:hypothetical protein n=1 Tax=Paenibacillus silviterrae TaxID=3242194 RepID=UPI0025430DA4|nr:hypothetical protein [Paenibacillus chinjuensis]
MAVVSPLLQLADLTPSPIQNVPAIGHKLKVKEHAQTIVDQGSERTVIVRSMNKHVHQVFLLETRYMLFARIAI